MTERRTKLRNTNTTEIAIPALAPGLSPVLPFDGNPTVEFELGPPYDVGWLIDVVLFACNSELVVLLNRISTL